MKISESREATLEVTGNLFLRPACQESEKQQFSQQDRKKRRALDFQENTGGQIAASMEAL